MTFSSTSRTEMYVHIAILLRDENPIAPALDRHQLCVGFPSINCDSLKRRISINKDDEVGCIDAMQLPNLGFVTLERCGISLLEDPRAQWLGYESSNDREEWEGIFLKSILVKFDTQVEIISVIVCLVGHAIISKHCEWLTFHAVSQCCFIRKRTLEKAILLYQKTYPGGKTDQLSIVWRPYYLNYNRFVSSTQSVDKSEVSKVRSKGVSEEKMSAMRKRVHQIATANGIKFRFGGKIGSRRDAHRLIHFVQTNASPDMQDAFVERLFQAYHEEEMDISNRTVLEAIAVEAGLDSQSVKQWLHSEAFAIEVDEEAEINKMVAVTGVPTFITQGEYRVDGAQDLQEFFEAFGECKRN
ncbi:hypothetical protein R6Q59_009895 [Mikania micrantha]